MTHAMSAREPSTLVGFDADAACDRLLEAVGDDLLVCAEYTAEDYQLLYVSDALLAEYGSEETMTETADAIHRYIDLDFRERELFLDLYPTVEDVEALVTVTDRRFVARVLSHEADEGCYFSVPLDHPIGELIATIVEIVDDR